MNRIFHSDNLSILRALPDESVDLVYLDPPFNSRQNYSVRGRGTISSGAAFSDLWFWSDETQVSYDELMLFSKDNVKRALEAFHLMLGKSGMFAYIVMIVLRLVELERILAHHGSIYLHCDQRASAHLRLMMDAIFKADNYLNTIVWCYGLGGSSKQNWPRKHDDIHWYAKHKGSHYFKADTVPATSERMRGQYKKAPDYWMIPSINNMAKERSGYPTQKPLELLTRIVISSCPEGGLVLDPFCGSGTTLCAAHSTGRNWMGIDVGQEAVNIAQGRLKELGAEFEIVFPKVS